jgi:DeoR/GlpR family transcriptional regulator of sugar metabolism
MAGSMTRGAAIPAPAAVPRSHCAVERRQLIMQAVGAQGRVDAAAMAGQLQRLMLSAARRRIVLADHTTYNRAALFKYGNLSGIDVPVTGGELPERDAYRLESAGLKQVIRA